MNRPQCICGEEMGFLANNRRSNIWICSCGKLLVETGECREWYTRVEGTDPVIHTWRHHWGQVLVRKEEHAEEDVSAGG